MTEVVQGHSQDWVLNSEVPVAAEWMGSVLVLRLIPEDPPQSPLRMIL